MSAAQLDMLRLCTPDEDRYNHWTNKTSRLGRKPFDHTYWLLQMEASKKAKQPTQQSSLMKMEQSSIHTKDPAQENKK
ncbi:hypothetical protein PROFUN_10018 [Planoprotostelium fungivorum]|uniref:Uncharacterized protein n=1 Tax=Planoprotostelium fungivorum TaxID=1890364 RepID=A0A2P6NFS0_9EUKA|nr:hypothetical protein PROFUN_10018 [Planoprotostelium fungivorum]